MTRRLGTLLRRGLRHLVNGKANLARKAFRQAINEEPENREARLGLVGAMVYDFRGEKDLSEAMAVLEPILDTDDDGEAHVALGHVLTRSGNISAAVEAYRTALLKDPADPLKHLLVGHAYLHCGEMEHAKAEFQEALDLSPDYAPALLAMGLWAIESGDAAGASTYFKRVVEEDPGYTEAQFHLGRYYLFYTENLNRAILQFKKALLIRPDFSEARHCLGLAYQMVGDIDAAEREWRTVLATDPTHGPSLLALGELLAHFGDQDEAEHYLICAMDSGADPRRALTLLGWLYFQREDVEGARETWKALLEIEPGDAFIRYSLAQCYILQCMPRECVAVLEGAFEHPVPDRLLDDILETLTIAYSDIEPESVLESVNKLLRLVPGHPKLLLNRAIAENILGQYDRAQDTARMVISKDPTMPEGYWILSQSYRGAGILSRASHCIEKAHAMFPDNSLIIEELAEVRSGQGRWKEAVTLWETVSRIEPDDHTILAKLARAYRQMQDMAQSIRYWERFLAEEPHDSQGHALLAEAYLLAGDEQSSLRACERALRMDKGEGLALILKGVLAARNGRYREALGHVKDAWSKSRDLLLTYRYLFKNALGPEQISGLEEALRKSKHKKVFKEDLGVVLQATS